MRLRNTNALLHWWTTLQSELERLEECAALSVSETEMLREELGNFIDAASANRVLPWPPLKQAKSQPSGDA